MKKMVALAFLFQAAVLLFSQDWEKDFIVVPNFRPIPHEGYRLPFPNKNISFVEDTLLEESLISSRLKERNWTNITPSILQRKAAESIFSHYYDHIKEILRELNYRKSIIELQIDNDYKKIYGLDKELFVAIIAEERTFRAIFFER